MTKKDWRINIENLAASVSAEYGSEVAESVFRRYGATCFEDLSPIYVDGFVGSNEEIHFLTTVVDQDQYSPLKRTLKDPMFDRIFKKATDITISGMSNPAKASVFYIDPSNCQFRLRRCGNSV